MFLTRLLKYIFILCALLSLVTIGFIFYHIRHHKLSFILDRSLIVANVAKSLAQNNKSLLSTKITKKRMLKDYFMIEKESLLDKGIKTSDTMTTQFLNYNITFFSYNAFLYLLREIFIHEEYGMKLDNKAPIIIDCGSNIGISILFFKMAYPDAKIIGFEADPANFTVLMKNIVANKLHNIDVINKAVSDQEGTLTFNRVSTLCAKLDQNGTSHVEATKLSNYINKPVDLLKMDIEGAEVAVLRDLAAAKKLSHIKNIIFEFHYSIGDNNHLAEVLNILETNGFHYQIGTSREGRVIFDKDTRQPLKDRCLMIYAYHLSTFKDKN